MLICIVLHVTNVLRVLQILMQEADKNEWKKYWKWILDKLRLAN